MAKQIKTFVFEGIPGANLQESIIDEVVNDWLRDNQKIKIEDKVLSTSVTTFSPDGGHHYQTVVMVCLVVIYRQ